MRTAQKRVKSHFKRRRKGGRRKKAAGAPQGGKKCNVDLALTSRSRERGTGGATQEKERKKEH